MAPGVWNVDNVKLFNPQSFKLEHWMLEHSTRTTPPVFTFKVLSKHTDALCRKVQKALMILHKGNINRRNDFSINEIIRMDLSRYQEDKVYHRH